MLDINIGLLLFVAVLFLSLIYILNKMLYVPLLAFMDKREETIKKDLSLAKEMGSDVDKALSEASQTILEAKAQAHKIREEALIKAKEKSQAKIDSLQKELEEKYEAFAKSLLDEKENLKKSIESKIPDYQNLIQSKLKNIS